MTEITSKKLVFCSPNEPCSDDSGNSSGSVPSGGDSSVGGKLSIESPFQSDCRNGDSALSAEELEGAVNAASSSATFMDLQPYVHLESLLTGYILEVAPPRETKGNAILLSTRGVRVARHKKGNVEQLWRLTRYGQLECGQDDLVLEIVGKIQAKSALCVAPRSEFEDPKQIWKLTDKSELMHVLSGLYLTVRGGNKTLKAELWVNVRKNSKAQQWRFDEEALNKAVTLLQGVARAFQAKRFMRRLRAEVKLARDYPEHYSERSTSLVVTTGDVKENDNAQLAIGTGQNPSINEEAVIGEANHEQRTENLEVNAHGADEQKGVQTPNQVEDDTLASLLGNGEATPATEPRRRLVRSSSHSTNRCHHIELTKDRKKMLNRSSSMLSTTTSSERSELIRSRQPPSCEPNVENINPSPKLRRRFSNMASHVGSPAASPQTQSKLSNNLSSSSGPGFRPERKRLVRKSSASSSALNELDDTRIAWEKKEPNAKSQVDIDSVKSRKSIAAKEAESKRSILGTKANKLSELKAREEIIRLAKLAEFKDRIAALSQAESEAAQKAATFHEAELEAFRLQRAQDEAVIKVKVEKERAHAAIKRAADAAIATHAALEVAVAAKARQDARAAAKEKYSKRPLVSYINPKGTSLDATRENLAPHNVRPGVVDCLENKLKGSDVRQTNDYRTCSDKKDTLTADSIEGHTTTDTRRYNALLKELSQPLPEGTVKDTPQSFEEVTDEEQIGEVPTPDEPSQHLQEKASKTETESTEAIELAEAAFTDEGLAEAEALSIAESESRGFKAAHETLVFAEADSAEAEARELEEAEAAEADALALLAAERAIKEAQAEEEAATLEALEAEKAATEALAAEEAAVLESEAAANAVKIAQTDATDARAAALAAAAAQEVAAFNAAEEEAKYPLDRDDTGGESDSELSEGEPMGEAEMVAALVDIDVEIALSKDGENKKFLEKKLTDISEDQTEGIEEAPEAATVVEEAPDLILYVIDDAYEVENATTLADIVKLEALALHQASIFVESEVSEPAMFVSFFEPEAKSETSSEVAIDVFVDLAASSRGVDPFDTELPQVAVVEVTDFDADSEALDVASSTGLPQVEVVEAADFDAESEALEAMALEAAATEFYSDALEAAASKALAAAAAAIVDPLDYMSEGTAAAIDLEALAKPDVKSSQDSELDKKGRRFSMGSVAESFVDDFIENSHFSDEPIGEELAEFPTGEGALAHAIDHIGLQK